MTTSSSGAKEMLSKLRPTITPVLETTTPSVLPDGKEAATDAQRASSSRDSDSDGETVHRDAQPSVQRMEATTQAWSKSHLIFAYFM